MHLSSGRGSWINSIFECPTQSQKCFMFPSSCRPRLFRKLYSEPCSSTGNRKSGWTFCLSLFLPLVFPLTRLHTSSSFSLVLLTCLSHITHLFSLCERTLVILHMLTGLHTDAKLLWWRTSIFGLFRTSVTHTLIKVCTNIIP